MRTVQKNRDGSEKRRRREEHRSRSRNVDPVSRPGG
jgi:hypothetical protein